MDMFGAIIFWTYVVALAVASWYGQYILHKDQSVAGQRRYRRFTYWFALALGLLPVVTGDWEWSLLTVPLAEFVAHFWILGRDSTTGRRTG